MEKMIVAMDRGLMVKMKMVNVFGFGEDDDGRRELMIGQKRLGCR